MQGTFASGAGPIYLSDLNCDGTETSLLDCARLDNQPLGLQSCEHQQDVAIRCRGMYIHTYVHTYVRKYMSLTLVCLHSQMWMNALPMTVVNRTVPTPLVALCAIVVKDSH
ncbi:MAG: hypothetical protein HFP76_00925 [Methylococcales symbiont of Iophon sp. n. MRB-2018]|nr:MAG: hypothetical protein HFP76_00925 [Methylococcales symbiont of Iophon sp. n. MRB-2018]